MDSLIAKWKRTGYEKLCCVRCIQSRVSTRICFCRFVSLGTSLLTIQLQCRCETGYELSRLNMYLSSTESATATRDGGRMRSLRVPRMQLIRLRSKQYHQSERHHPCLTRPRHWLIKTHSRQQQQFLLGTLEEQTRKKEEEQARVIAYRKQTI